MGAVGGALGPAGTGVVPGVVVGDGTVVGGVGTPGVGTIVGGVGTPGVGTIVGGVGPGVIPGAGVSGPPGDPPLGSDASGRSAKSQMGDPPPIPAVPQLEGLVDV